MIKTVGGDGPHKNQRIATVVRELLRDSELMQALGESDMATEIHRSIADGVRLQLCVMRNNSVHTDKIGRLIHNELMEAATCNLHTLPHGSQRLLAETLGCDVSSVDRALRRHNERAAPGKITIPILDPERAAYGEAAGKYKKKYGPETIAKIQESWANNTRPSPDMCPIAKMLVDKDLPAEEGGVVTHGIHWQECTDREMYDLMKEQFGELCGLTFFVKQRPYFVRKPKWRGCLCPTCHSQRLLYEAYTREIISAAANESNECTCEFCAYHKTEHAANRLPPSGTTQLLATLFCPKANVSAHPECGFTATCT